MEEMDTSASSSWDESEDVYDNSLYNIRKNRFANFRRSAHLLDVEQLKKLFLETIREEKRDIFDYILQKLEKVKLGGFDKDFYEECFKASVNCTTTQYMEVILYGNERLPAGQTCQSLAGLTHHLESAIVSCRFIGANEYIGLAKSPLLMAIRADDFHLVSVLLYYGADTCNLPGGVTAFMYAILCNSVESIQRLLINYVGDDPHDPFVGQKHQNYLYRGLLYGSPIVLDIIDQIPDDYGDDVLVIAVHIFCSPRVFERIWEIFDYDEWRENRPESALMFLLNSRVETQKHISYIKLALNNERKLRLDIEYENTFYICAHFLISTFYLKLKSLEVDEDTINGLVYHLLSHGALVHKHDVDLIYNSVKSFTPLLKFMIYEMPVEYTTFNYGSLMYFQYTPLPDLELYILGIPPNLLEESLITLKRFYAFSNRIKNRILYYIDANNDALYNSCRVILEDAHTVPSLLQLTRDNYRMELCEAYEIQSSHQMMRVLREINMPEFLQDLILFKRFLY